MPNTESIVLSGGCFWGVQELIRQLPGVIKTEVGYCGGDASRAKYKDVKTGSTNHAESIEIIFDPKILPLEKLLLFFFQIHDPTTVNQQGNDVGTQYRSVIFYSDLNQKVTGEKIISQVNASKAWKNLIVTQLIKLDQFHSAEFDHQDYLQKNPGGYTCHYIRPIKF